MTINRQADEGPVMPWKRIDATLLSTARALRHAYDRVLAEISLTLPESSLLAYVAEAGPLSQTQIASALDAGRAATGHRVDALEKRGLVKRQAHVGDRRVWLVVATDEGRELVNRINEIDREFAKRLRLGISREERQHMVAALIRMQKNIAVIMDNSEDFASAIEAKRPTETETQLRTAFVSLKSDRVGDPAARTPAETVPSPHRRPQAPPDRR